MMTIAEKRVRRVGKGAPTPPVQATPRRERAESSTVVGAASTRARLNTGGLAAESRRATAPARTNDDAAPPPAPMDLTAGEADEVEAEAHQASGGGRVARLAVQLEHRMRTVECLSAFVLLPEESTVGAGMKKALDAYHAAEDKTDLGGPMVQAALALLEGLAAAEPAEGGDRAVAVRLLAIRRLHAMANMGTQGALSQWLPLCTCAMSFKRAGKPQSFKVSFHAIGSIEVSRAEAEEREVTAKMQAIASALEGDEVSNETVAKAELEFQQLSPLTPLEIDFKPRHADSRLIQVQSLLVSALVAVGATYKPGRAPQGATAYQLDGRKKRGSRGGKN